LATTVTVIESANGGLAALVRGAGMTVRVVDLQAGLASVDQGGVSPDVLVIDLRTSAEVPSDLATFKRRHPRTGVVIAVPAFDPKIMLDAMRAGVTEAVADPVSAADLRAAIDRVLGQHTPEIEQGKVFAFLGAKGGVGTTTLAVNIAAALAADGGPHSVLLADFHVTGHGDAALFLGVEPRFSIVDAIENVNRLDRAVLHSLIVRAKCGVDVLAAPERPSNRNLEGHQLRSLLERLSKLYPYVVIDLPQSDLGAIDAIEPVTVLTLVVNQELPTVRRASRVAALLRQRYGKERVGMAVSRYDPRAEIGQEDVERVAGLPVWAVLPSDYRRAVSSANAGEPIVAESGNRLAKVMQQYAQRLAGRPADPGAFRTLAKTAGRFGGML
jgi:pilus assembly protein CpaE